MAIGEAAVIGAGPMGLVCAWRLAKAGFAPVIYEADDRAGGMSASFDFDGQVIERYYHFVNLPDIHLSALLEELGMLDQLRWRETRMGFFRRDANGRASLHAWGNPRALLAFPDAPLITRLRYGLHAFRCKFLKDLTRLDDVSASDWFCRWEGRKGYDIFWRFLFEKKFFQFSEPLSSAWIASRIRRVANSRESLMRERLGYLAGGTNSLLERLQEGIALNGGKLRLSSPVMKVRKDPDGAFTVESTHGAGRFRRVISTIPLQYLPDMAPCLPESYLARIARIPNVGCACALFRLGRNITENFWLNVDVPEWDIPGIIEYSNLRPMKKAFVYVPFYMPQDHPNWKKADHELLDMARKALGRINAEAAASEEKAAFHRYYYAQPVCRPGFRHLLPVYATGIAGFWAADTSHSFPEDRSINESVRIGNELAELVRRGA